MPQCHRWLGQFSGAGTTDTTRWIAALVDYDLANWCVDPLLPDMPREIHADLLISGFVATVISGMSHLVRGLVDMITDRMIVPTEETFLHGMQYGQLNHHCAGCACAMRASGRVVELRQPVATFAPTADQGPRRRPPRR